MNDTGLASFVESRDHDAQSFGSVVLLAGGHGGEIAFLQRVQAGFDALVGSLFAGAVADATFGGFGIRHKFSSVLQFRARKSSEILLNVNGGI